MQLLSREIQNGIAPYRWLARLSARLTRQIDQHVAHLACQRGLRVGVARLDVKVVGLPNSVVTNGVGSPSETK